METQFGRQSFEQHAEVHTSECLDQVSLGEKTVLEFEKIEFKIH